MRYSLLHFEIQREVRVKVTIVVSCFNKIKIAGAIFYGYKNNDISLLISGMEIYMNGKSQLNEGLREFSGNPFFMVWGVA
jgi:hypothetical protein